MSQLLDENDELLASSAREMTLGTGSILAIFLGLALLCALFFGFGYNVGHKSASAALLASAGQPASAGSPTGTSSSDTFSGFKTAAPKASPASTPANPEENEEAASANLAPSHSAATTPASSRSTGSAHSEAATRPTPAPGAAARPAEETPSQPPAVAGAVGSFFVQVAAVSHPEDASLLLGALRAKGYAVTQRSETTDKLIHIQVGPFASKPTAEAMRQRLQGDGYNAIIK